MEIGIDIVEIERIKNLNSGRYSLNTIYTANELRLVGSYSKPRRLKALAGSFAVKEAVVKALGTGFGEGITPIDIESLTNDKGKPYITLYNNAKKKAHEMGFSRYHVSISHSRIYAVAMVILEE